MYSKINRKNFYIFLVKGCCLILFLIVLRSGSFASDQPQPVLQQEDCVKCHWFKVKTVNEAGSKHATEIGCLDCHPQHPPKGENTIVPCVLCHTGQAHFEIGDCLHCHTDPHKPLASLRDTLKAARRECLSCHTEVGQQMSAAPSRHAELYCTSCHDRHGFIPGCLDCHEPHLTSQTVPDCLRCHPAHRPLQIVPAGYVPASFCQVCHKKEANDLAGTKTNHGAINCVYCHKGEHPSIPKCQDCHGLPHSTSVHSQYRDCLDCHGDAHDLISNR